MITIMLNGKSVSVSKSATLSEFLSELGLNTTGCAVAVNHSVAPKPSWQHVKINHNDEISLFRVVAGG